MPKIIIVSVTISPTGYTLYISSDLLVNNTPISFYVFIGNDEFLNWSKENADKKDDDFILIKVKEVYEPLVKVSVKAATLVNQVLTW